MPQGPTSTSSIRNEVLFQVLSFTIVGIFYAFDRGESRIEVYKLFYFLSFAIAALIITYVLLPRFLYTKKYWRFIIGFILVLAGVILIEEKVLEQIFFPDTRAQRFPGILFSLLSIVPPIIILSSFKFAWDAFNKQEEVRQLQSVVKESELQFLKSQINPHFLFNNLNNLYSYSIDNSPKTPEIILKLSGVLRYMLYECKEEFVQLKQEISNLENFTKLSELQIEDRGTINFSQEGDLLNFKIAPLILVVFVENAFKHSQASLSEDIMIDINIHISDNGKLVFSCKNNFHPSMNTESLSKGIGLENVKKRLDLIYPQAHTLSIDSTNNIYTVNLTLQLTQAENS